MKNRIKKSIIIIMCIILLDQLSKYLIKVNLDWHEPKVLIENIASLTLTKNTGGAFSIFQENNLLLFFAGILITITLFYYLIRADKKEVIPIALIIGGALGNLLDRALHGGVIDFIQISIWPVFNIADIAITLGVTMLIIKIIKKDS
ncbi:MAG: signal peptidase II [Nanoarchaeota archaeon]